MRTPKSSDRRHEQARCEGHFPIRGRARATVEPASAIGFRRRGASSPRGDFAARRQFGGVGVNGKEVIRLELRIIGEDLLWGRPTRQPLQNLLNGDTVPANAWF